MYWLLPTKFSGSAKLSSRAKLSMKKGEVGTCQQVTILYLKIKESFNSDKAEVWRRFPLVLELLALSLRWEASRLQSSVCTFHPSPTYLHSVKASSHSMVNIPRGPPVGKSIYNYTSLGIGPTVVMGENPDVPPSFQINQRDLVWQNNELIEFNKRWSMRLL